MKNNASIQTREQQQEFIASQLQGRHKHEILQQTPAFLLASNIVLPEEHIYPFGNISFQFRAMHCTGLAQVVLPALVATDALEAILTFPAIGVAGTYAVTTKSAPVIDIDTAGNMMPLSAPGAAGADTNPTIPHAQQAPMLDNARRQREILSAPDNPNGQQLMSTYNIHSEVYNELFQSSLSLRKAWQQGGAVAQMAIDTHNATNNTNSGVVNDENKVYGSPQVGTYNQTAFFQQNAVMAACYAFSSYSTLGGTMQDDKYTQAAVAALNFKKAVGFTNNTQDITTPMTSDEVHAAVQSHNGPIPTSSLAELQNHADQSIGSAGAAEHARNCGWAVLNEAQRSEFNYFLNRCWEEKLLSEREVETDLWTGNCQAALGSVTVVLRRSTPLEPWTTTRVQMPAFELDIEDSHWHGAAGTIARERLSQIYFVRSLLNEKIKGFLGTTGAELLNALPLVG